MCVLSKSSIALAVSRDVFTNSSWVVRVKSFDACQFVMSASVANGIIARDRNARMSLARRGSVRYWRKITKPKKIKAATLNTALRKVTPCSKVLGKNRSIKMAIKLASTVAMIARPFQERGSRFQASHTTADNTMAADISTGADVIYVYSGKAMHMLAIMAAIPRFARPRRASHALTPAAIATPKSIGSPITTNSVLSVIAPKMRITNEATAKREKIISIIRLAWYAF